MSHERFAYGTILILETILHLQGGLNYFNWENLKVDLKTGGSKTKIMYNTDTQKNIINTEGKILEGVG